MSPRPLVRRRPSAMLLPALVLALLAGPLVGGAGAATTTDYATLTPLTGAPGAYRSSVRLPGLGRPEASMTSTSGGGSAVGLQNGENTFLPAGSPPGVRFGSSRGEQYVNLAAARGAAPSVTTYTFATPMPAGWGFVLGDVDADAVQVAATAADGTPLSADDLGFQEPFNYQGKADRPTWDAGSATLRGSGSNTDGAAGWFVPTVPVRSLTLTFSVQTGFPTYQTWFAAVDRAVSGTVVDSSPTGTACDVTGREVRLLDAAGTVLASQHPTADGGYAFPRVAAAPGFRVELSGAPDGCAAIDGTTRTVDLSERDATADFELRHAPLPAAVPVRAEGVVRDTDGAPVADARATVRDQAGSAVGEDRTGADGRYAVAGSAQGDVTITLDPPDGYVVVGRAARTVTVPIGGGTVGADFRVRQTTSTSTSAGHGTGTGTGSGSGSSTTPVGAGAGTLPDTGGPALGLLRLAGALLLAGAALVGVGCRRGRG